MSAQIASTRYIVNGIAFDVPVGYASFEDYVRTMRLNKKTVDSSPKFAQFKPMYDEIEAKLVKAGY